MAGPQERGVGVPRLRADLAAIDAYHPGRPIEDVVRETGIDDVIKLASNESPFPPFPQVQKVIAKAAADLHRYPDNDAYELRHSLGRHLGVDPDRVWLGCGSVSLLMVTGIALGGPGTSAVFAEPGFSAYKIATQAGHGQPIAVALDQHRRHDLAAMRAAIRPDTTVVYVCNPNNPTATYVPARALFDFIDAVPNQVTVVVDEAYAEFATAADFGTALPLATTRDNVLVARTFSKVYGLAGLRVGYMIGEPWVIKQLRRVQVPFSVNRLAQVAAVESLAHQDLVSERIEGNAARRAVFQRELAARHIRFDESQTNFVAFQVNQAGGIVAALVKLGVIVRPLGEDWIRVTIGSEAENNRFFRALDQAIS